MPPPRPPKRPPPPKPSPNTLSHKHPTSSTESSIQETFSLFASPDPSFSPTDPDTTTSLLLPSKSLRPALRALGIKCSPKELTQLLDAADPEDTGSITYDAFLGVAKLELEGRDEDDRQEEIDEAFALFLGEGKGARRNRDGDDDGDEGEEEVITIKTLKRVAEVLKEKVDEGVLRDMVLEANGGRGVRQGVGRREFGEVMRRAGVIR
ncbi:MAG: hypothetical protein Q9220_003580 [cf. Caloplaca sp. 1 TL-2023]